MSRGRALAGRIGRVGVWTNLLERLPAARARDLVGAFEDLGYGAVWFPESLGSKEAFAHAALLLRGGTRVVLATGIANIFARDAMAMANGARALEEAHPGRFLPGLGVSHLPSVTQRGGTYERPVETMAAYLAAMDAAPITLPGAIMPPRVLAALGPRMLKLAGAAADGAHPYFVPIEHTPLARRSLGPDGCLAVELACVVATDPVVARRVARSYTKRYLSLLNYANNLKRLGWADADLAGEGSDRLVDALVAWGTVEQIRARVQAHHDAGADHVALQVLREEWHEPPLPELGALAKVLL